MIYDTAIIGAGAAGLMAAIQAKRLGFHVLILDGQKKVGAKILMSGGTRCNVTNKSVTPDDYESETINIVRNILRAFPPEDAIQFFKNAGIHFVLEAGGKYFPSTHSGKTILAALLSIVDKEGVLLESSRKVTQVNFNKEVFDILGEDFKYKAKTVVLATGGLSYPRTGSDGVGYKIAQSFGHKIIRTSPALTPFQTEDLLWKSLKGVSLPACLTLWINGKKILTKEGDFLFTHFGFSGPVVLDISRYWLRVRDKNQVKITADFLYRQKENISSQFIHAQAASKKTIKNFLIGFLPERLVEAFAERLKIDFRKTVNQLSRQERESVSRLAHQFELPVSGAVGYSKAEVTAGGIDLREINSGTLESRKQPGLYFAGEIMDVDGRIGGFNFQWAWASGTVAARGIKSKLRM